MTSRVLGSSTSASSWTLSALAQSARVRRDHPWSLSGLRAVGDLTRESVVDVLRGPELARMRRMIYGLEEAPANFICRNCVFALSH